MGKILCAPLSKCFLFLTGYLAAVAMLRAESHTFDVLLGRLFGDWFRFGFSSGLLLLVVSLGLLLVSVWRTSRVSAQEQEAVVRLFRRMDFFLLAFFALYGVAYLLFTAHSDWTAMTSFFLPLLAYTVVILAMTEFTARLRDKELLRTLYWVRFFRVHPVWRPLGLLFAALLAWNLLMFLILAPEIATWFGFSASFGLRFARPTFATVWVEPRVREVQEVTGVWVEQGTSHIQTIVTEQAWWGDLRTAQLIFSALALVALTYFVTVLLGLADKYDEINAEKVRAERLKSELITNVSHDIKTPLTSIINYVDLLKTTPLADASMEYVAVLDKKSLRLKVLIEDLMEASKAGTGNLRVEMQQVNLAELIGQIAGEFDEQFARQDLALVLRGIDEPMFAQADNRHLWRTIENLFTNAAKYALPGTRIFAELSQREEQVRFTLKNTSAAPIELSGEALSEQFIRGDRAREGDGSGLGLYIAKSLVELMEGRFDIRISGDLFEVEIVLGAGDAL